MMWTTLLKTTQWMNLLITGNGRDPWYNGTLAVQARNKNANARNDSSNWGEAQQ